MITHIITPGGLSADRETRTVGVLRQAWGEICTVTTWMGAYRAEHDGHVITGDTPDALQQAIIATWGQR